MWSMSADVSGTTDCTISLGAVVVVVEITELAVVMSKLSPLSVREQPEKLNIVSTTTSDRCAMFLDMSASADAVIANVN